MFEVGDEDDASQGLHDPSEHFRLSPFSVHLISSHLLPAVKRL